MMTATAPLTVDLAEWPGVVIRVSNDARIVATNGRLDFLLGTGVVGRRVIELLDHDSSLRKWERIIDGDVLIQRTWELIFCASDRVLDTGAYSVMRIGEGQGYWLIEHPTPPLLSELASEVALVNTDLAMAQRTLVIERARLAAALTEVERSNRALDEFAHAVSHDLKAPLRAIREYADVPLPVDPMMPSTEEERAGDLRRIGDLAARMRRMIDGALEYARAGRPDNRVEAVDTSALLREIVEFLAPAPDVTIHVASELPTIDTERVPFEQVFRNLLANAITYRRQDHAHIEVSAVDTGDHWEFVVADNGPGIPESQQQHIWRLFHTSRPGEGTGVGLALVRRIIESQHGTVSVRSAPGEGAEFRVRWPKRAARSRDLRRADDVTAR